MNTYGIARWARCAVVAASAALALGAQAQVIDFSGTRGAGVNQTDVLLENLRLLVPVPNPQQPGTTTTVESNYNILFRSTLPPCTWCRWACSRPAGRARCSAPRPR